MNKILRAGAGASAGAASVGAGASPPSAGAAASGAGAASELLSPAITKNNFNKFENLNVNTSVRISITYQARVPPPQLEPLPEHLQLVRALPRLVLLQLVLLQLELLPPALLQPGRAHLRPPAPHRLPPAPLLRQAVRRQVGRRSGEHHRLRHLRQGRLQRERRSEERRRAGLHRRQVLLRQELPLLQRGPRRLPLPPGCEKWLIISLVGLLVTKTITLCEMSGRAHV